MRAPWISREHHTEVIAAKDALILSLEAQNAILAERLAEPVAVSVSLPENFAVVQPAVVRHKKPHTASPDPRKEVPEVDWANVDPNNSYLMAQLAAQEYGRQLGPIELSEWVQRVKRQVAAAKDENLRNPHLPVAGTLQTKEPPERIKRLVEQAEAV